MSSSSWPSIASSIWAAMRGAGTSFLGPTVERLWNTTQHYRRAFTRLLDDDSHRIVHDEHHMLVAAIRRTGLRGGRTRSARPYPAHPPSARAAPRSFRLTREKEPMAIATINPATGETVETFEPHSADEVQRRIAQAYEASRALQATGYAQRAAVDARHRRTPGGRCRQGRGDDHRRDGQAHRTVARRGAQVRQEHPLLRRQCRILPRRRGTGRPVVGGGVGRRHRVAAAGRGAGRDAVELPAVAGDPVRRARTDGRQHRVAQARIERAAVRALPRRSLRAGRLSRRLVPHPADRGAPTSPR